MVWIGGFGNTGFGDIFVFAQPDYRPHLAMGQKYSGEHHLEHSSQHQKYTKYTKQKEFARNVQAFTCSPKTLTNDRGFVELVSRRSPSHKTNCGAWALRCSPRNKHTEDPEDPGEPLATEKLVGSTSLDDIGSIFHQEKIEMFLLVKAPLLTIDGFSSPKAPGQPKSDVPHSLVSYV